MRYLFAFSLLLLPSVAWAVPDEIYVDPAIAADSGSGTIGSPYGDVQYALNNVNHGGDGARINVKAGTAEVLASGGLTLATYHSTNGAPSATAPFIIQGYTSAAGDGGIAEFTGTANSAAFWIGTTTAGADVDYATFRDLKITTAQASGYSINIDNGFTMTNVELISPVGAVDFDNGVIEYCKISYVGTIGVTTFGNSQVRNNIFIQTSGTLATAVSGAGTVRGNIFNVRAATAANNAVILNQTVSETVDISHNTILANITSGTNANYGITLASPSNSIENNYIEGFGGTNGAGINITSASVSSIVANNAFFANTANISNAGLMTISRGSTTSLSASGVTSASTGDYTPTADLIDAGWPAGFVQTSGNANFPAIGAITPEHAGGGSNVVDPFSGSIPGL